MLDVLRLDEYAKHHKIEYGTAWRQYQKGKLLGYQNAGRKSAIFIYVDQQAARKKLDNETKKFDFDLPEITDGNHPFDLLDTVIDLAKYQLRKELSKDIPDLLKVQQGAKTLLSVAQTMISNKLTDDSEKWEANYDQEIR